MTLAPESQVVAEGKFARQDDLKNRRIGYIRLAF
jgi:hypothetical protein